MGAPIVTLSVCISLIFFFGILAPDKQQGLSDGLRVFLTNDRIVPSPGAILNTSSFTATLTTPCPFSTLPLIRLHWHASWDMTHAALFVDPQVVHLFHPHMPHRFCLVA
jgi:hypothetical protein